MRLNIANLTNRLINDGHYDNVFLNTDGPNEFVRYVKLDLELNYIQNMSLEEFGDIVRSLKTGDIVESKAGLLNSINFGDNCVVDTLRERVALCLARAVRDQFYDRCPTDTSCKKE